MASGDILNFEELLGPISGDSPCGENLRWDPIHDEIKAARQEQDRDVLGSDSPVEPNWQLIVDKATDALAHRSKDLMIAGYLMQALVEQHGFAGLRDSLRLVNGLLDSFWGGLYPQADGDDLEPRAAPIVWFTEADRGGRIPTRVRDVALVGATTGDGQSYSWSYWKSRYVPPKGETEDEGAFAQRKADAEERAKLFEDAIAPVPVDHFVEVQADIEQSAAELARLAVQLDEKFGDTAPGTTALRQSLEDCAALVRRIIKDKGGLVAGDETEAEGEGGDAVSGQATVSKGPIKSRADALRRLSEVAEYFRQAEPHSPVSYLVDRAAAWGRMPLDRLLGELVKDTSVRDQIDELLGLKRGEGE